MVSVNARLEYIDSAGIKHILEFDGSEPLWVGRRSECSIHSLDENLSREHCWVERDPATDGYLVQDNASRAGTYVNGESIDTHVLAPGDVIQCASMNIHFSLAMGDDSVPAAVTTLNEHIAEMQREVNETRARIEGAIEARKAAEAEADRWREEEAKIKAQCDRLEARLRERDEQKTAEANASSQRQEMVAEYEASLKKARQEAAELTEELQEARAQADKQRARVDKQKHELTRLRKEVDGFAAERDELWGKLKAEKDNSESLSKIVERQEQMIDALRESAIERDKLIQELRAGG